MAFHTPHGSARFRLPWSWSSFDYRTLCARAVGAVRRRALRDRQGRGRARRRRASRHRPRRRSTAPLVVDALGWRRVLGPGAERPAARGADLARPRGPSRRARRRRRPRRLGRPLARPRAATPGRCPPAGEQRVGVGSYEPRDHVKEPTRAIAARLGVAARALPGQLVPARAAPGGRGRRLLRRRQRRPLLPAVGRGDPHGVLLRHRLRARAAAACSPATRRASEALARLRRVLGGARAGVRGARCGCSG